MSEKWLCPRLADYLVIVGSRTPNQQASIQPPELLRRYPIEDHKDFPLPLDVVYFCQPEGCVSAGPKKPALRDAVSFVFALTDKDSGKTRYGVCLNFYRSTERVSPGGPSRKNDGNSNVRRQSWRKSIEKSSDSAFSSDHRVAPTSDSDRDTVSFRSSETTSHHATVTPNTNPFLGVSGTHNESESGGSQSPSPRATRRRQRSKNHSLTSLCLLSHHPFFSSFRQCLSLLKKLIDACHDNTSPRRVGASKLTPRDSIWSVLTGKNLDSSSSYVLHDVREIETWILRLLSSPVSVPGSTRVELEVLPPDLHPPLIFALPDKTRFSLSDFPLHLPLELLGVDSCLQVLTLILLECKVVIQSRDYSALSMSVMALVTLLYPLEYMFPVIPLLPTCMSCAEQLLLAPTPYIIGITASFLPYKKHFRLPDDVWLVDLDANKITGPTNAERDSCDFVPALPDPEALVLRNHLKQAMGHMDLQALRSMSSPPFPQSHPHSSDSSSFSQQHSASLSQYSTPLSRDGKTTNPLIFGNDVDSVDVATRVAMVKFFNSANLLANFSEHTRTLRLYPRPVVAFQISSFLRSRPHPPSPFLCKFARTQAVEYLAEWSLAPTNQAFLRVQTGVYDPAIIGDKGKWYAHNLSPIKFDIYTDVPGLVAVLRSPHHVSAPPTDESGGSGSEEGGGSGGSTSSYSSLSDFVTELASSDFSPTSSSSHQHAPHHHPPHSLLPSAPSVDVFEFRSETTEERKRREAGRNITSLCSSLDLATVYTPPSALTLPPMLGGGGVGGGRRESSGSETSESESGGEGGGGEGGRGEVEEGKRGGGGGGNKSSLLGQIASQAKELVKETKRQSSQEGLLSHVDKLKTKTKEKLSEVRRQGSSSEDSSFLSSPLEHITSQAKRAAEEAGKSMQAGLSQSSLDDLKIAGRSTWDDITKTAKKGLLKSLGESSEQSGSESRRCSVERKDSVGSVGMGSRVVVHSSGSQRGGRDFFTNMSSELNGIASQTSSMFSELFGGNRSVSACGSPVRSSSSLSPSMTSSTGSLPSTVSRPPPPHPSSSSSSTSTFGPFPTGRRGLVERSNLIRHTTAHLHPERGGRGGGGEGRIISKLSSVSLPQTGTGSSSAEAQAFLNEVANQVLAGEGVGWLRVGRLKKLLEDESYRVMLVAKINKTLERKVGPDDHVDDACISKGVWKGMLKLLQLLVNGLEYSFGNRGLGGMASAFQVMEIAHTHYWTKDLGDMTGEHCHYAQFLDPNSISPGVSNAPSPLSSAQASPDPSRRPSSQSGENVEVAPTDSGPQMQPTKDTAEMFRDLFQNKKQSLLARLSSSESHIEGGTPAESVQTPPSSIVMNPAWPPGGLQLPGNKPKLTSRLSQMSLRSTVSDTELEQGSGRGNRSPSVWSSKSALAAGLRYHAGSLIPTGSSPTSPENGRMYLFEGLLKERSPLWDQMQFWEDAFLDAVAMEREMVGMDQGPREMMDRYQSLSESEKKRLEHEEDRLLATQLFNLVSFMLMMNVSRQELRQKVRRLLGKSHMGLVYSQEINQLLDQVSHLKGNSVDLKPAGSRLAHRQTFAVHAGSEPMGDLLFMEVRDDGLVLRNVAGAIVERWWWERLVNMTYSPKTRVVCLWRRVGGQTQLRKYHSRKCRQLYEGIRSAMERAAARGSTPLPGTDLGGEFPVEDLKTGQGGLLQVCMEGVGLLFANSKFFVRLDHIRKCFTQKGGIFVLEEYNPKTRKVLQRRYKSSMAENICYSVLCVFSYVAAGHEHKKRISIAPVTNVLHSSASSSSVPSSINLK